jgi:hypothetical protein
MNFITWQEFPVGARLEREVRGRRQLPGSMPDCKASGALCARFDGFPGFRFV